MSHLILLIYHSLSSYFSNRTNCWKLLIDTSIFVTFHLGDIFFPYKKQFKILSRCLLACCEENYILINELTWEVAHCCLFVMIVPREYPRETYFDLKTCDFHKHCTIIIFLWQEITNTSWMKHKLSLSHGDTHENMPKAPHTIMTMMIINSIGKTSQYITSENVFRLIPWFNYQHKLGHSHILSNCV